MWKNSRYGETLNKNTHPQTCTNLTLFLNKNTFIILFLYDSPNKGLVQLFSIRQVIFWSEKSRENTWGTISVTESQCNVGQI